MQGCPRRRSVGACDEPADRRGGQPVFDTAPAAGGLFEPTSVPLQWLPGVLAARRPRWDPQPARCRKTQTGYRVLRRTDLRVW